MAFSRTKAGIGLLGISIIVLCILYSVLHAKNEPTTAPSVTAHHQASEIASKPVIAGHAYHVTVKSGDTLASIFNQHHLSAATLEAVTASRVAAKQFTQLQPGDKLTLHITKDHHLTQLTYPFDHESTLIVTPAHDGYQASIESKPVTIALRYKSGVVKQSLNQASNDAGLTVPMLEQLQEIYHGTINFKHIKRGDHFAILYQEYFVDGKKDHPGNIMAATLSTGGHTYPAIRYTYPKNHTGYFSPHGNGLKPAFLRIPVPHYTRISSHFTYRRMDPYLHVMRPHLGVDFAAPRGTPIISIGRGKVIFEGRDHGYGNAMIIRYSKKYKALYGHMEKFNKHVHKGSIVQRGQTIGYIGSTGWSTGPHLHFEVYVHGIPHDPLKLKLPRGDAIPASYTKRYHAYAQKMLHHLDTYQHVELTQHGHHIQ